MGEVYEVEDTALGARVALKTVRAGIARDPAMLRRFKREVLLARSVTHPNVCRVFDLGRHEQPGGEVHFLTMELLAGETLSARVGRSGRLARAEALPLVRGMAAALEAAHRAGVVHRDFKSANVMVVPAEGGGERAVVTDFGLAVSPEEAGATATRVAVGTPAYMAPEQVEGGRVGAAADLYALGVVLYEMVTGALPFQGAYGGALVRLALDAPSPRRAVPDLEEDWEQAILRCLRREPGERFGSAAEVLAALEGVARPAMPVRRHGLPAERDAFFGRETELVELEERLKGDGALVTLVGPAGAGKTRLALHHAHAARAGLGGAAVAEPSASAWPVGPRAPRPEVPSNPADVVPSGGGCRRKDRLY